MTGYQLWIFTETGVHAGGDEAIGAVDEPIQRDRITGYPVIHGQSLKGAERRRFTHSVTTGLEEAYGSKAPGGGDEGGNLKQGWLDVGEARLVAFPIPTLRKTFAWVTSPHALARAARDSSIAGIPSLQPALSALDEERCLVVPGSGWGSEIRLGDYKISASEDAKVAEWARYLADRLPPAHAYLRTKMSTDLAIVADAILGDLAQQFTELAARVQLEPDQKTVKHGPFYSEYLPSATLLAAYHGARTTDAVARAQWQAAFNDAVWTIGGDESVGKGIVSSTVLAPA
jgi:CRISPR-associated protein Cmr4